MTNVRMLLVTQTVASFCFVRQ